MRIPAVVALFAALAVTASAQSGAQWSYQGKTGPYNWGKLDPAYRACSQGREQSPVDIRGAHLNKALQPIEFHYLAGPVTIENTGHTVTITPGPGSYIVLDGVRYDLQQFHFHHPSEHAVKGKLDDLEVHLVHKSADGKLAVVAVRLREDTGFANATLATLWAHMPAAAGQKQQVTDIINPGGLLPSDRGYWTYTGSLTAPPCTEGVRWFLFEQDIAVSREQVQQFANMYRVNSRPLQDLHGRRIEASE